MSIVVEKPLSVIGSSKWRNATINGIKLSESVVSRCGRQVQSAKALNHIGELREESILKSNTSVLRYTRDVRVVVCYLQRTFAETNEEIKALMNSREEVEKLLDHLRKDIKLNAFSNELRSSRPKREVVEDEADKLIMTERRKLLQVKKNVENMLNATRTKLEDLRVIRERINTQLKERSRVLDLLCHTNNIRPSTSPRFVDTELPDLSCDPLGPYTPQVKASLIDSRQLRLSSEKMRSENKNAMEKVRKDVKLIHNFVNNGLKQKSVETKVLVTHLGLQLTEQRHMINKAKKQASSTELAYEKNMGPKSTRDLEVSEKLNRPLLKIYHRHPGCVVTEGRDITKGAGKLFSSLQETNHNIKLANAAKGMLKDDHTDKRHGLFVDKDVLRLRKRRSNHRWVIGKPSYYTQ